MFDFKNQNVIVTGGTRGIGRGICESFLRSGANVICTFAGNEEAAQAFLNENENYKEKIDLYKFDVSDWDEVQTFIQQLEAKYNGIDVLVNNSGIRKDNLTALMSPSEWDRVLQTNLTGTFYMTKSLIPIFLRKKFGRIINISSIGGNLGLPGQANYAASKAGQVALSKSVAKEVAKKGITINNVAPGFIDTEFISDLPEDQVKEYKKQVPMKRFGKVSEVAHAVQFLASPEAAYISGTTIEVSGGL